jgi:MFS family permease
MIAGTGLSRTGFSIVYALATVCSALVVVVIGSMFDRRGAGLTWLLVAGGLAAGGLLMSVATGAAVAIAGLALLRAFGQGSFPLVATLLVARTFEAWRGRAMSVAAMGVKLGAAILPPVAAVMIAAVGWRASLQITALAIACLILPLALVVRRVTGAHERRRPNESRAVRLEPRRALAAASARARRFPWLDGGAILLIGIGGAPLVATGAVFHATSLLAASGLGIGGSAAALSAMALGGIGGAIVGGVIVDRLGVRVSLVAMNLVLAAGACLLLVAAPIGGYAGFVLLGVATGTNSTVSGAAWGHTFGVERLGELQGVGEATRIGAAALGPLPLALALSLTGSYGAGLAALAALAATCAALGLRMPAAQRATPAPAAA